MAQTLFQDNLTASTNWATNQGSVTFGTSGATFTDSGTTNYNEINTNSPNDWTIQSGGSLQFQVQFTTGAAINTVIESGVRFIESTNSNWNTNRVSMYVFGSTLAIYEKISGTGSTVASTSYTLAKSTTYVIVGSISSIGTYTATLYDSTGTTQLATCSVSGKTGLSPSTSAFLFGLEGGSGALMTNAVASYPSAGTTITGMSTGGSVSGGTSAGNTTTAAAGTVYGGSSSGGVISAVSYVIAGTVTGGSVSGGSGTASGTRKRYFLLPNFTAAYTKPLITASGGSVSGGKALAQVMQTLFASGGSDSGGSAQGNVVLGGAIILRTINLQGGIPGKSAQNFTMWQTDSILLDVAVTDASNNPVDITGATIEWVLQYNVASVSELVKKTTSSGITITDVTNGKFQIELDSADTAGNQFGAGNFYHQARITDVSGNEETLFIGTVTMSASATTF